MEKNIGTKTTRAIILETLSTVIYWKTNAVTPLGRAVYKVRDYSPDR